VPSISNTKQALQGGKVHGMVFLLLIVHVHVFAIHHQYGVKQVNSQQPR